VNEKKKKSDFFLILKSKTAQNSYFILFFKREREKKKLDTCLNFFLKENKRNHSNVFFFSINFLFLFNFAGLNSRRAK
jgi:hypothetical protein